MRHTDRRIHALRGCLVTGLALATLSCGDEPPETNPIPPDVYGDAFVPTTGAPGWTEGVWSVEDDGSSSYRVPLWVPPGRAGVQPSLALSYNSRRGNGLPGFGWALEGFSAITPCARTVLTDGYAETPELGPFDRLCLDGAHLEPVPSAIPGWGDFRVFRNGTVRVDRATNGFIVYHPDGRIATYGVSDRAIVGAPADTRDENGVLVGERWVTLAYLLSRVEDRDGNAIEYHYDIRLGHEEIAGQPLADYWPTEITYTHGPGLAARRSIRFFYSDAAHLRNDVSFELTRGAGIARTQRLIRIEMWAPTEPGGPEQRVRLYALDHRQAEVSERSVLRQIRECDGAGVCREPITFETSDIAPLMTEGIATGYDAALVFANDEVDGSSIAPTGAFFSDGRTYVLTGLRLVAPGDRVVSSWQSVTVTAGLTYQDALVPFDYDGDGRTELLRYFHDSYDTDQPVQLSLVRLQPTSATAATAIEIRRLTSPCGAHDRITPVLADMDGDGLTDLVHGCTHTSSSGGRIYARTAWTVALHDRGFAEGFGPALSIASPDYRIGNTWLGALGHMGLSDANGDGRTDLVFEGHAYGLGTGELPQRVPGWSTDADGVTVRDRALHFDVNGDGLPDVLEIENTADLYVRINTGNGFAAPIQVAWESDLRDSWFVDGATGRDLLYAPVEPGDLRIVDLDRDGRLDLVVYQDGLPTVANEGAEPVVPLGYQSSEPDYAYSYPAPLSPRLLLFYNRGTHFQPEVPHAGHGATPDVVQPARTPVYVADDEGRSLCAHPPSPDTFRCSRRWPGAQLIERDDDVILLTNVQTVSPTTGMRTYWFHRTAPDMLVGVDRGGERDVTFRYELRHFDPETCAYPDRCGGQVRVVSMHEDEHGTIFEHDYVAPHTATNGEGWLGFEYHQIRDAETTRILTRHYDLSADLDFGHIYARGRALETSWVRDTAYAFSMYSATFTQRSVQDLGTGGMIVPVTRVTVDTWELGGAPAPCTDHPCLTEALLPILAHTPLTRATTDIAYRATGAVSSITQTVDGVETRTTRFEDYEDRYDTWQLRLPRSVSVTSAIASGREATLATSYKWNEAGHASEIRDDLTTTNIFYSARGLPERIEVHADDIGTRVTRLEYDSDEATFAERVWNALEHQSVTAYLPATGQVVYAVDPAGVETKLSYDGLGRPRSIQERGVEQNIEYEEGHVGTAPAFETLGVRLTGAGGIDVVEYADRFGRVHERRRAAWSGDAVEQFVYDSRGRPQDHHVPHFGTDEHRIERVVLDQADRPRVLHRSLFQEWTYFDYKALTQTSLAMDGRLIAAVTYDAAGQITRSEQAAGDDEGDTVLEYVRGPFGVVESISDQDGAAWLTEFDEWMRERGSYDPDAGWSCYARNSLGEITHELDGAEDEGTPCSEYSGPLSDAVATYAWDAIGRLTGIDHRTDGKTQFFWDGFAPGLFDGAYRELGDVTTTYGYDGALRVGTVATAVGGITYEYDYSYDDHVGRIAGIDYPEVDGSRFHVRYEYDDHRGGALRSVWGDSSDTSLWSAVEYDAWGRVTQSTSGTSLTRTVTYDPETDRVARITTANDDAVIQDEEYHWTEEGDLYNRHDFVGEHDWVFEYDFRHRLTGYGDKVVEHEFDYDRRGNAIVFEGTPQIFAGTPHRLAERAGVTFGYDDEGRRTSTTAGFRVDEYTQFDLPASVRAPDGTTATFVYDALGQRVQRSTLGASTTTIGPFELRHDGSASMQVFAAGEVIAEVIATPGAGRSVFFTANDHLGSPEVVTDESGAVKERYEFSPFGTRRRRGADGSVLDPSDSLMTAAFTGHDQEDDLGLVDMGGRFYDPETGQFLTRDPIVHSALDRDSFNAYSYVRNNPLRYTDPSGFDWCDELSGSSCGGGILELLATAGASALVALWNSGRGAGEISEGDIARAFSAEPVSPPQRAARDEVTGAGGSDVVSPRDIPQTWDGIYERAAEHAAAEALFELPGDVIAGVGDLLYRLDADQLGLMLDTGEGVARGIFTPGIRLGENLSDALTGSGGAIDLDRAMDPNPVESGALAGRARPLAIAAAALPIGLGPEAAALAEDASAARAGRLRPIGASTWESSGGLVYGPDKAFGNRVRHVLAHTVADASKPLHGVFSVPRTQVVGLLDEAWAMRGAPVPGDPGAFVVPMGRTVGTAGETSIRIIVRPNTRQVVTAYPVP